MTILVHHPELAEHKRLTKGVKNLAVIESGGGGGIMTGFEGVTGKRVPVETVSVYNDILNCILTL